MSTRRKRTKTRYRGVYRIGSVYQTRIEVPDPDRPGLTMRRWLTGENAKAVSQIREEEERKVRVGDYVPPSKQTLGRFLTDEWLPGLTSLKATTRSFYGRHVRCHIVPEIGHLPLQKLQT